MEVNKTQVLKRSGASITAALLIAVPFICGHEGESLKSYEDVVGVWTICNGVTAGVKPGMTKTKAECDQVTQSTIGKFMTAVSNKLIAPVSPQTLAAHTSFAYNIGMEGYSRSSTLRLTNQGHIVEGCNAMMIWHTAGGKDCRQLANNCHGLITRRQDEIDLCIAGTEDHD